MGTRPEIIKLSPIIRECERRSLQYFTIHTGQHYSDRLDTVFFSQLDLPDPDYNLDVGSASQGVQTGEMLIGLEEILLEEEPDVALVQGDTNSVLAGAIATSKLDTSLGHVEAGLRSNDRNMPEEINRIVADHVSDVLFAPTEESRDNLRAEGIPDSRIAVTGNTVVDALQRHREIAREKSDILAETGLEDTRYMLLTAHRAENVDDEARFRALLAGVGRAAREQDIPVVYPAHPRAQKRIEEFGIDVPERIELIDPLSYLDFLTLEAAADVVLTDSGGVQEEACILGVPCYTLRDSTERPETVSVGANRLSGNDPETIAPTVNRLCNETAEWDNPFGDGTAGRQIIEHLGGRYNG